MRPTEVARFSLRPSDLQVHPTAANHDPPLAVGSVRGPGPSCQHLCRKQRQLGGPSACHPPHREPVPDHPHSHPAFADRSTWTETALHRTLGARRDLGRLPHRCRHHGFRDCRPCRIAHDRTPCRLWSWVTSPQTWSGQALHPATSEVPDPKIRTAGDPSCPLDRIADVPAPTRSCPLAPVDPCHRLAHDRGGCSSMPPGSAAACTTIRSAGSVIDGKRSAQ